jgi:hypothetical protein
LSSAALSRIAVSSSEVKSSREVRCFMVPHQNPEQRNSRCSAA